MNVKNRTLFIADNLDIMRGINSDCIDLIYLDPPFNSKKNYKAPIGSPAQGASFKDIWEDEDIKYEWHGEIAETYPEISQLIQLSEKTYDRSMFIYLTAMAVRLFEMQRILKETGSIYLHCDPTASHYLKIIMDAIFGEKMFRNEIIWQRTKGKSHGKQYGRNHDIILFYSKTSKYTWNPIYMDHDPEYIKKHYKHNDKIGTYRLSDLTGGQAPKEGESGQPWRGINPSIKGRNWSAPGRQAWPKEIQPPANYESLSVHQKLDVLDEKGLICWPEKGRVPRFKRYLSTSKGKKVNDIFVDINNTPKKERTGYPTQKPLALLERIIEASSNEGDSVLDPFCGCATACVAAEKLNRRWVGIDESESAETITKLRLEEEVGKSANLFNPLTDIILRDKSPRRTDEPPRKEKEKVDKHLLYGKQNGRCNGCKVHFPLRNMTVDHIVPQSKSGTEHISNKQLLCGACNSTKGTDTQSDLIKRLKEKEIF